LFQPRFCPNTRCEMHLGGAPGFCESHGSYWPKCRDRPVPRFRCKTCSRTFSRQTFRHDCRDRVPSVNARVFELLCDGAGLRQTARRVGLSVHGVQHKFRKIARSCRALHEAASRRLPAGRTYLFDEEESYEAASIRPLTMPVLIEQEHWFVVASAVGTIRRLAPKGTRRRALQETEERREGKRPDESRATVRKVLEALDRRIGPTDLVVHTDMKASYATLLRRIFQGRALHHTTSSRMVRDTRNPLFPINTTLAMTRDNNGRLRRRSWLVTKVKDFLELQMWIFTVYRNYVRARFNRDTDGATSAMKLGLLERPLDTSDVLGWQHRWGLWLRTDAEPRRAVAA